jgi:uncharacterized protein YndB with AHSA1/START domain
MTPPAPDSGTTLVLRRTFTATRPRVFRAWLDPEALEHWLRPRGLSMTVSSLDARVGGSFQFDLENGGRIVGTYLDITPLERLVFTWSGTATPERETIVTLDFLDQGPSTEMVLTHEGFDTPELRARVKGGWPPMFDTLAELLSSPPPGV